MAQVYRVVSVDGKETITFYEMSHRIYREFSTPDREHPSFDERIKGPDKGLINAWEVGRRLRKRYPELAERAMRGELPVSDYKGGVDKVIKAGRKYGCLRYLAEWQGLRGEDLDIDLDTEVVLVCTRTGVKVTYTPDREKYS